MTTQLLDYFAAAALQGLIAKGQLTNSTDLARKAYEIARAMQSERNRVF